MTIKYNVLEKMVGNPDVTAKVLSWFHYNLEEYVAIICDEQENIIYSSKLMEQLSGYELKDLMNKPWTTVIETHHTKRIKRYFSKNKGKLHISDISIISKNGKQYLFNGMIDQVKVKEEIYTICLLKNSSTTSELQNGTAELETLLLASYLGAGLVHEIRNPLTSLKGFLQLVQSGVPQKEEYYNVMIQEIEKIEQITSAILNLAKPFSDDMKMESVNLMISDVLFIMQSNSDFRNVCFDVDVKNNLTCFCNFRQIKQVLLNLIKNAAESMDYSGTVKIIGLKNDSDGDIEIDIIDKGPGISSDVFDKINKPFFTTKTTGTGLGLMISKQILNKHNATLHIFPNIEKGTTFRVILPDEVK